MRYLIKFTKEENIKFISHLDLMRTIQRIIRRSTIEPEYSKGFNPHIIMSIAMPLSVGLYSYGEYLDLELSKEYDPEEVVTELNKVTPGGIRFVKAKIVINRENEKKWPTAMAAISGASYKLKIRYKDTSNLKTEMENIFKLEDWTMLKKTKKSEKMVDIRPLVHELNYEIEDDKLVVSTRIDCGSVSNLSINLLVDFIKENTTNVLCDAFVEIYREELFGQKEGALVSLYDSIM